MTNRMKLGLVISVAVLAGCAANTSQQGSSTAISHNCAGIEDVSGQVADLYANKVSAVKPVHEKIFLARAIQPEVVTGAELYVPAEPGMSGAYLDRLMSCHAGSGVASAHPNDPVRVAGVERVDVDEVGSNYRITVTGEDREAGRAIWRSAEQLGRSGGSVRVQQLAAAIPGSAL
ncbi:MAG: hypothetical protein PVI30_18010 [Myxococcales bacterium]|jgi:hypothetical protein